MLLARYGYLPATDDDDFEDISKADGLVKAEDHTSKSVCCKFRYDMWVYQIDTCSLDPVSVRCILIEELERWTDGDMGMVIFTQILDRYCIPNFSHKRQKPLILKFRRKVCRAWHNVPFLTAMSFSLVTLFLSTNFSRVYRKS